MSALITSFDQLSEYLRTRYHSTKISTQLPFSQHPFPLKIPTFYADLIDWQNLGDPLMNMVLPTEHELHQEAYEVADPIGDLDHEAVPGLIHRYPDRCLLLFTTYCAVHCRFCFRREVVGDVRPVQIQAVHNYLQKHTEVREIIFSGGDPFTFPVGFLEAMGTLFADLHHIKVWRFHTRVPAVDPQAVSAEWLQALEKIPVQQKIVVVHINHSREITPELAGLVRALQKQGVMVLSQSVLLKGVNDSVRELKNLFLGLVEIGIKPYYLHHLDKAFGTSHFRLSISEGKHLFQALRGNMSTTAMPEYVVELPDGLGKMPVMWLKEKSPGVYEVKNFEGNLIEYVDPNAT